MITEEITIKYLDIILSNVNTVEKFSVQDILKNNSDLDFNKQKERTELIRIQIAVQQLGETYEYFEPIDNRPGIFKLSLEGIKAKELGGHVKYQNSLKKKIWYNENWVGYLIALIVLLFSVYQYFEKSSLKSDYNSLKLKYDSLKYQSQPYKDSVVELKEQIELYKLKTSNDTLQPKNLNDLKTE